MKDTVKVLGIILVLTLPFMFFSWLIGNDKNQKNGHLEYYPVNAYDNSQQFPWDSSDYYKEK